MAVLKGWRQSTESQHTEGRDCLGLFWGLPAWPLRATGRRGRDPRSVVDATSAPETWAEAGSRERIIVERGKDPLVAKNG